MRTVLSELSVWAAAVVLAACSVKEDREACPCRLVLDFSGVDTSVVTAADLFLRSDGGFALAEGLDADDFRSYMSLDVPRGMVDVGIWSGAGGLLADGGMAVGGGLAIPVGEDCPRVYFHVSSVDASCESVRDTVRMRKNHCVMTVRLEGTETEPEVFALYGNVNGYMGDGSPSPGEFVYLLKPDGEDGSVAVLPRQVDNSLVMEVHDGTAVVKRFAIGEYVAESGYDWSAPDLKDITLEIDVALTKVELVVQGSGEVLEFEVVI